MTKFCKHPAAHPCVYCGPLTKAGIPESDMLRIAKLYYADHKKSYSRVGCQCCGGVDEPYMLKKDIWREVVFPVKSSRGFYCLACVQILLKRPLRLNDFMDSAPINFGCFGFDCRLYFD